MSSFELPRSVCACMHTHMHSVLRSVTFVVTGGAVDQTNREANMFNTHTHTSVRLYVHFLLSMIRCEL